jgi:chromate transporter
MGIVRAGWLGGIAAWTGFTLPSALLMFGFAFGVTALYGRLGGRLIHGFQLVAVAIVAQAVMTMQHSLAPDRQRIGIALVALAIVLFAPAQFGTVLAILVGAICGLVMFRSMTIIAPQGALIQSSKTCAAVCAVVLVALLVLLPIAGQITGRLDIQAFSAFYRSGALVFGGGHVVLPLLQNAVVVPGWVKETTFLSGYGAAQALPGPLFTFGAFLGASIQGASHCVRAPRTLRPERAWTASDDSSPAILGNSAQPSVCSECPSWSKCGCCWRPDRSTVHAAVDIYGAKLR